MVQQPAVAGKQKIFCGGKIPLLQPHPANIISGGLGVDVIETQNLFPDFTGFEEVGLCFFHIPQVQQQHTDVVGREHRVVMGVAEVAPETIQALLVENHRLIESSLAVEEMPHAVDRHQCLWVFISQDASSGLEHFLEEGGDLVVPALHAKQVSENGQGRLRIHVVMPDDGAEGLDRLTYQLLCTLEITLHRQQSGETPPRQIGVMIFLIPAPQQTLERAGQ